MKLNYDEPLSSFAFNLNLRRYMKGDADLHDEVGRCRLTASKPALKARLVSALESII